MKITMHPAISLDGFIAKLDGDSYSWVNQEDEKRYEEEVKRCGAVIAGRTTYDQYKEDFYAYGKDVTVFVCTNDKSQKDSGNVKFLNGSPNDIIQTIENLGFKELIVCGGGEINGILAEAGLVDEMVISIQSVILGEGIPLFGSKKPSLKLELLTVNQDIKGVVQNHYKVVK